MTFKVYAKHMYVGTLTVNGDWQRFVDTSGNIYYNCGLIWKVTQYKQLNMRRF